MKPEHQLKSRYYAKNRERLLAASQAKRDALSERIRLKDNLTHQERYHKNRAAHFAHLGGKCAKCGFSDPRALQFDHKDPLTKTMTISNQLAKKDQKEVLVELEKCQLLCSNCHDIKTFGEKDHIAWKVQGRQPREWTCRGCGTTRTSLRARLPRYCNKGCRPTKPVVMHKPLPLRAGLCLLCGKPWQGFDPRKTYCSEECRRKAEKSRWAKRK